VDQLPTAVAPQQAASHLGGGRPPACHPS
jgi:hypothetical protein